MPITSINVGLDEGGETVAVRAVATILILQHELHVAGPRNRHCRRHVGLHTTRSTRWPFAMHTRSLNPFTAPSCKISERRKNSRIRLQTVYFQSGPITHLLSMLCFLWKSGHMSVRKREEKKKEKKKRLKEFQISHFYWSFSINIIAVKGSMFHFRARSYDCMMYDKLPLWETVTSLLWLSEPGRKNESYNVIIRE